MARQRFVDNQNDAAAHPLSERGARSAGCVALSNWLSVGSGQSVVLLRGRFAQNFKKIFFKIIQICHNEGKALQKCRYNTVSTSVVVRLLSARCPVVVQLLTGQQLDNNWTTTGQRAVLAGCFCGEKPMGSGWENVFFCVFVFRMQNFL